MAYRLNPLSSQNEMKENTEGSGKSGAVHSVSQRLNKELLSLMMNPEKSVSAFPDGENLFQWTATIHGPANTVFEGYKYKLSMEFPKNYPYSAPTVKFSSPCYHPNVDPAGNICLDILKEKWSALYDVRAILLSIQSLLADPNVSSPLNVDAAKNWSDQEEYKKQLVSYQKGT